MLRAIAIDDEPPALKVLENFCAKTGWLKLEKTFTRASEAITYLQTHTVDLIFLDIQMPAMSGIELYKAAGQNRMVIFTTAFGQYAVQGFELNAVDYLLKPFTYERFVQAVEKAARQQQIKALAKSAEENHIAIKADYSVFKLNTADIVLVEGFDDYLKIHLASQKPVVARMTMKSMLELLPPDEFMRVHRSFIVNLGKINHVRNKTIFLNGHEVPVGKTYEEGFFKFYN